MDWNGLFRDSAQFLRQAWAEGVFGAPYTQILIALAILLVALLVRGLVARIFVSAIRRAMPRVSPGVIEAFAAPVKAIVAIVGVDLALRTLALHMGAQEAADRIVRSLIAATVFWALFRVAGAARTEMKPLAQMLTPAAVDWLVKALQLLFVAIGAAAVLEIWGVEVAPLLAGLGIFGVAVALGAQDLFKNLIAGLAILAEKRFSAGDWIQVDGVVEGTVERINFRSTLVRQFDLSPVHVPNSKLADNAVVNCSRMIYRRISWTIGLEYGTTAKQLRAVRRRVEDYLTSNEGIVQPPDASLFVRLDAFDDSSIALMLYCFTRSTNWGEWLALKEELLLTIKDIVEEEGSAFAFPSRTLYVDSQSAKDAAASIGAAGGEARQAPNTESESAR